MESVTSGSEKVSETNTKGFSVRIYLNRRQMHRVLAEDHQARDAMLGVARLAGDHARILAPYKTGALRDSIIDGVGYTIDGVPVAAVAATVPYALYQELGTRVIPPSPYLRPALHIALGRLGLEFRGSYSGRRGLHGGGTVYFDNRAIWGRGKFFGGLF